MKIVLVMFGPRELVAPHEDSPEAHRAPGPGPGLVELGRQEVDGNPEVWQATRPPLVFDGDLYVAIPAHMRDERERLQFLATGNLELAYELQPVFDLELERLAERLYTPAEANEYVERVREPLEKLVQSVNLLAEQNGKLSAEQVVAGRKALIEATRVLELLKPEEEPLCCGKAIEGKSVRCLLNPDHLGDCNPEP